MSASDQYQALVIGSGQGGTPLCMTLANAGLRTALIERQHVGGTCINQGCTPTKNHGRQRARGVSRAEGRRLWRAHGKHLCRHRTCPAAQARHREQLSQRQAGTFASSARTSSRRGTPPPTAGSCPTPCSSIRNSGGLARLKPRLWLLQFIERAAEILEHLAVDVLDPAFGCHDRDQTGNRLDDQPKAIFAGAEGQRLTIALGWMG